MPIYRDIYDGPPASYIRDRTAKRWIVIHSTQNDASAEGEAGFATRRTDGVSSHYYVDGNSIVQSLDTDFGAHHVGSSTGNRGGISYELTGFAAWSRSRWLSSIAWPLLAGAIRRDCAEHGIEPRELTVTQIRAGTTGIMTHNQARLAWGGTDHTDPGPNFPMDHLVNQVRAALEGDDMALSDRLDVPGWVMERWPEIGGEANRGTMTVATALVSGYGHSRAGNETAHEALRETRAGLAAVLAAVAGEDAAEAAAVATRQAVRDEFAALGPALAEQLADVPAERVEQALRAVLGSLDEGGA